MTTTNSNNEKQQGYEWDKCPACGNIGIKINMETNSTIPTPLTDEAELKRSDQPSGYCHASFTRALETKLTTALAENQKQADRLKEQDTEQRKAIEIIGQLQASETRLREALEKAKKAFYLWDGTTNVRSGHYVQLTEAKDAIASALKQTAPRQVSG